MSIVGLPLFKTDPIKVLISLYVYMNVEPQKRKGYNITVNVEPNL